MKKINRTPRRSEMNTRIAKIQGAREDIEKYARSRLFTPTYQDMIRGVINYSKNYVFTDRSGQSQLGR